MQRNSLQSFLLMLGVLCATPLSAQELSAQEAEPSSDATNQAKDAKEAKAKTTPRAKASPKKVDPNVIVGRIVEGSNGVNLFATRSMDMQFGMRFATNDNTCTSLVATIPFPMDWPEQSIEIVGNQMPDSVAWQFRDLPAGAKQLVMRMNSLGANNTLELVVQVKVKKSFINAPTDTSIYRIPKSSAKELKWYLGSSPYIDVDLSEIKRTAKKIEDSKPENAWRHVEMIYDWVRDTIEYRNGDLRQIKEALKDKQGDCEEMTGIFVALCRASDIPARCVWIPEHCYPEFYLEDEDGVGYWFPCQAAGERQFGQMHDYRPILQKGDRFKVPEEIAMQRYVSHFFSCKQRPTFKNGRDVVVEPVLDLGPLEAEIEALRQNP